MANFKLGNKMRFFVPRSCHVDQFTFHILLPGLKFTIFIHLSLVLLVGFSWAKYPWCPRLFSTLFVQIMSGLEICENRVFREKVNA